MSNDVSTTSMIPRALYPQLDHICWHISGHDWVTPQEAFALYEANWAYVDVHQLSQTEKELLTALCKTQGGGLFSPKGGQPISLEGVVCV